MPFNTVICAIARNEDPYLLEWLAWYRLLGVDHFFVYDNVSDDGTSQRLMRLEDAGVLTRVHWPRVSDARPPQIDAYADFLMRYGPNCRFAGFLDLDEFVVPHRHQSIPEMLDSLPTGHQGLALHWRVFGSSGHQVQGDGLVVERFKQASARTAGLNALGKAFVRTNCVRAAGVHYPRLQPHCRYQCDWQTGIENAVETMASRPVSHTWGQINHYMTKSRQEFERKRARGRAARPAGELRNPAEFDVHDCNDEADDCAALRAPAVRAEVAKLETLEQVYDPAQKDAAMDAIEVRARSVSGLVRSAAGDEGIRLLVNGVREYFTTAFYQTEQPDTFRFHIVAPTRLLRPGQSAQLQFRGDSAQRTIRLTEAGPE